MRTVKQWITFLSQSPEKFLEGLDTTSVHYSDGNTWEDEGLRPFYGIYTAFENALAQLYSLKQKSGGPKVEDVLWSAFVRAVDFGIRDGIQKLKQRPSSRFDFDLNLNKTTTWLEGEAAPKDFAAGVNWFLLKTKLAVSKGELIRAELTP